MAAAVETQLSTASEEFEDGSLDPRVQVELEKLNKSSDNINTLEVELDEARASFRQALTDSTQRLNALSKKLGNCIEKARPYYDARMKAKEAQIETQNVALRFERACSQQMAAKEMVNIAEQGYFKKGQPFDPAWQEMLNHATIKVNDAERERLEIEISHQVTASIFNDCEQHVKYLQKELKRNIAKSRPYFEQKAKFNQTMEERKRRVGVLEQAVADAKMMYSDALKNLEKISDEIHQRRQDAQLRKKMGTRGSGVGAEEPTPAPQDEAGPKSTHSPLTVNRTNSQTQTDDSELREDSIDISAGGRLVGTDSDNMKEVLRVESTTQVKKETLWNGEKIKLKHQTSITEKEPGDIHSSPVEEPSATAVCAVTTSSNPTSLFKQPLPIADTTKDRQYLTVSAISAMEDVDSISETASSNDVITPGSGPSSVHTTAVTSPETEQIPEAHVESTRTNMEIMETLQKAKNFKSPFLRPNRSRDDLLDDASDNESIPGSMASMSVLDDDQIESLMLEGDFASFLARQDESEVNKIKSMTLPAKLSYLQNYMNFKPEFLETDCVDLSKDGSQSDSADIAGAVQTSEEGSIGGLDEETMLQKVKSSNGETLTEDSARYSEDIEHKHSSQLDIVIDSTEYDACWSCQIDMDDLPQKRCGADSMDNATDTTHFAQVNHGATPLDTTEPQPRVLRGYSFEEDSELQRVYKELSAFEKLMRRSSSESPPSQSPPVVVQHGSAGNEETPQLAIVSTDQVQITVTAADNSPECQKDPLGVMPIKAITSVTGRVGGASVASPSPPQTDTIEHFV